MKTESIVSASCFVHYVKCNVRSFCDAYSLFFK